MQSDPVAERRILLARVRAAVWLGVQVLILIAICMAFFFRVPQVTGPSMMPTVSQGELVLISTLTYRVGPIQRGDVVAVVRIERGVVIVNGHALAEPYVRLGDRRSFPEVDLPDDAVFVLGDNRSESEDSRFWGPVPVRNIIGKALFGLLPPKRLSQ
jgi:signal peptidase I